MESFLLFTVEFICKLFPFFLFLFSLVFRPPVFTCGLLCPVYCPAGQSRHSRGGHWAGAADPSPPCCVVLCCNGQSRISRSISFILHVVLCCIKQSRHSMLCQTHYYHILTQSKLPEYASHRFVQNMDGDRAQKGGPFSL